MKCRESSRPEDKRSPNRHPGDAHIAPLEFSTQAWVALRRRGVPDLRRLQTANGRPAQIRSL